MRGWWVGGGILQACGKLQRKVKGTFVNHSESSIRIHTLNHPEHRHLREDLFTLSPEDVFPAGTFCSLLWGSPQCTFFSVARGAACVNEQDRSHANSVTDWIKHLKPEVVMIENVTEFKSWGPVIQKVGADGEPMWAIGAKPVRELPAKRRRRKRETLEKHAARMALAGMVPYLVPDPARAGEYFNAWVKEVEALGYSVDCKVLRSSDYGGATIRKRLFVQFCRLDTGKRIVWPLPSHAKTGPAPRGPWRTAKNAVIDWSLRGESVFSKKRALVPATFRRLAIGLVKFGLSEFMLPSHKGFSDANVRSVDAPVTTLTTKSRAEGLVTPEAFILPKDQGWQKDHVMSADYPLGTIQTTSVDGVIRPSIIPLFGQSGAVSEDEPLGSLTTQQNHYLLQPMVAHLRGDNAPSTTEEPLRSLTAGGTHELLADAIMMAIDQTGGGRNHGTYSKDEPVRTLVTKANASVVEFSLHTLEDCIRAQAIPKGVDASRVIALLKPLMTELRKAGRVDVKPYIYVYYGSGSVGSPIDEPVPTLRCKASQAICYPVLEFDGVLLKLDLFYRMLSTLELQRAMGFPDDYEWGDATKTDIIKAIGNSVSREVAEALTLSWFSQREDWYNL